MVNQYHNDEENNTTACRQFIRDENSECQIVNNGLTVKNNNTNNNNNNNYSDIQNYNNSTDNNLTRTNMQNEKFLHENLQNRDTLNEQSELAKSTSVDNFNNNNKDIMSSISKDSTTIQNVNINNKNHTNDNSTTMSTALNQNQINSGTYVIGTIGTANPLGVSSTVLNNCSTFPNNTFSSSNQSNEKSTSDKAYWFKIFGEDVSLEKLKKISQLLFQYLKLSKK